MDWTEAITRFIAFDTFANIWYWLAVVVSWSVASNWLIGVPFDMLYRARKYGAQEVADLAALVDINVRRIMAFDRMIGPLVIGLAAFMLSGLGMMGFYYDFAFAEGLFVLGAPLSIVGAINLRLAHQLSAHPLAGKDLVRRMFKIRFWTQVIAMIALFFTAMYGIYHTISQMVVF